jgi:hypothetical protein
MKARERTIISLRMVSSWFARGEQQNQREGKVYTGDVPIEQVPMVDTPAMNRISNRLPPQASLRTWRARIDRVEIPFP